MVRTNQQNALTEQSRRWIAARLAWEQAFRQLQRDFDDGRPATPDAAERSVNLPPPRD